MLDAKVIPDETVAPKDKPVVATLRLERFGRKKLRSTETKIRSGKLKGLVTERFRREVLVQPQQPRSESVGPPEAEWKGLRLLW